MQTIQEKLEAEVVHGFPNRKFSKRQFNEMVEKKRKQFIIPREEMSVIIAHCIYNEEEFFEQVLYDDLKINDLDMIHILDGAWTHTNGSIKSTDNTINIINKFKTKAEKIGVKVVYETHPENQIWSSEPEKRNYQFDSIRKLIPTPNYIIVKDGDEFFHHMSGRQNTWLKKDLVEWIKYPANLGLINCNAF